MTPRNISDPIAYYINLFADFFSSCFHLLKSIEFLGTDLLSFTISILILGALFPLLFSLVRSASRSGSSSRDYNPNAKFNPKNNDSGDS